MKSIQELAQKMTKEEFLKYADDEQLCPITFKLNGSIDEKNCDEGQDNDECRECWNEAIKDIHFKDESLQLFQQETSSILTQLAQAEDTYKKLSEQRDKLKAQLLEAMDKYSLDKWENDKFSITYVKGGTTTTIDSKKVKELYPDIFQECSKISNRKASIRFNVKWQNHNSNKK